MKRKTVVFWAFCIDILGPRYERLSERRKARRLVAKKLKEIERAVLLAAKANLPRGFKAVLS